MKYTSPVLESIYLPAPGAQGLVDLDDRQSSFSRVSAVALVALFLFSAIAIPAIVVTLRQGRKAASGGAIADPEAWSFLASSNTSAGTAASGGATPVLMFFLLLTTARPPKRGRGQIISDILSSAADGETTKTHLMYKSSLDSRELKKYISLLTGSQLLAQLKDDNNHESYRITEKGREFLQRYNDLRKYLNSP